jgi:hypothetical protein
MSNGRITLLMYLFCCLGSLFCAKYSEGKLLKRLYIIVTVMYFICFILNLIALKG